MTLTVWWRTRVQGEWRVWTGPMGWGWKNIILCWREVDNSVLCWGWLTRTLIVWWGTSIQMEWRVWTGSKMG